MSSAIVFGQGIWIENENIAVDDFFSNETDIPDVRKLNGGTKILVTYEGNWPEEMKGAFEYAVKIWEENLPMCLPINIRARLVKSPSSRKVLSDVRMNSYEFPKYGVNETRYPLPLVKCVSLREHTMYNSLHKFAHVDSLTNYFDMPDIEITYSRAMLDEFSFNIDVKSENKYDFVTLALRDIAMGLGFCNRYMIVPGTEELQIPSLPRTPFEHKIFAALGSPADLSEAYINATQGSLNVGWGINLYAPNPFINGTSLRYTLPGGEMPLSDLLAYDFPKGYVMRDISNYDWTSFFSKMMGWEWDIITSTEHSDIEENISNDVVIPYQGDFNFSFTDNPVEYIKEDLKPVRVISTDSINTPYVSIGEYCEPYYLGRDQTDLMEMGGVPKLIISVQKKDGSWETLRSQYVSGTSPISLKLDTITFKEPLENYARSTTGALKYRFVEKTISSVPTYNACKYKVQYLTRDFLPQKAVIGYSGIYEDENSPSRIASESDEYFIDVKIGLRNIEGATKVIVDQTDEGSPEPFRYDIEDFKKGFFIANLDRECSTKLEVTTYNKNGQTTSDAIYIPALGYPEEISDLSYNVSNGKLMINGIPNALIKNGKIHYTITSALNPAANYNGVLADDRQVDISGLSDGFYVITIYSNNRRIGSGKFVK